MSLPELQNDVLMWPTEGNDIITFLSPQPVELEQKPQSMSSHHVKGIAMQLGAVPIHSPFSFLMK